MANNNYSGDTAEGCYNYIQFIMIFPHVQLVKQWLIKLLTCLKFIVYFLL